jgi:GAF domain-containing protein
MSDDPAPDRTGTDQRLLLAFVDMADTLVDDFDVVEVLYRLSGYCVSLLGASAAGLLLSDQHDGLQVMAASSERARLLELLQLQADEGPCLDAYRTGELVQIEDLAAETGHWPTFAPEALAEGFRSVQAVPLRLRNQVIGALNLFSRDTGLDPQDLRIVRALADTATIGILQERAIRRGEVLTEQLQRALNSRVVIEQAKGVLSHAGQVPMDEAFEQLRAHSRTHNLRLSDVAAEIADGRINPHDLLAERESDNR